MAYYVNIMRGPCASLAQPFLALSDPEAVRAVLAAVRQLVDESEQAVAPPYDRMSGAVAGSNGGGSMDTEKKGPRRRKEERRRGPREERQGEVLRSSGACTRPADRDPRGA